MGRRAAYTTDELKSLVDKYVEDMGEFSLIKINDLVYYCNEKLNCNPKITYHMIMRNNPEVKEYIEKLNKRAEKLLVFGLQEADVSILPDQPIDMDHALNAGEDDLRKIITDANKRIATLSDLYMSLSSKLKDMSGLCSKEKAKKLSFSKEATETGKQLEEEKMKNKKLKKQLKEEKALNVMLLTFIEKHVSEPIWLNHLKELKIIDTEDEITMPEGIDVMDGDAYIEEVVAAFEEEIVSTKTQDMLVKLQNL